MGQKSRGQHLELVIWSLWHPTAPWGSLWEERRLVGSKRHCQWERHQGCPPRSPPQASWLRKARSCITRYLTPRRPRQSQLVRRCRPWPHLVAMISEQHLWTPDMSSLGQSGGQPANAVLLPDPTPPDHPSGSWAPALSPL